MPEQFPSDLIVNPDDRIVEAWASVEIKDNQGDLVPTQELYKSLLKAMDRGLVIIDSHTNKIIGKALNFWVDDHPTLKKSDGAAVNGIKIHYRIYSDCEYDDSCWEEIKNGTRTGVSIGGKSYSKDVQMNDGVPTCVRRNLFIPEISSVRKPANAYALNDAVNFIAKEDTKKGEQMPDKPVEIEKKEEPKKDENPKKDDVPPKKDGEAPAKTEGDEKPPAAAPPAAAIAPGSDGKLDRIITLLEHLVRARAEEANPPPAVAPVEKPKEAMCKEDLAKGDVIPAPSLPPQKDLSELAKGEQTGEPDELAYDIATGKKTAKDIRKIEEGAQERHDDKIKAFLKKR